MPTLLYRIAERALNTPLLIMPEKAAVIAAVLGGRIGVEGGELQAELGPVPEASRFVGEDSEPAADGRRRWLPYRRTAEGVGILSIVGSLVNRGAWLGASSGLVSYEGIKHQLQAAAADAAVRSIILDLASPGGEAIGAFEAADAVRKAAAAKPVIAVVNGMAASAAYAIASAATRIVTTPTGLSGSIGVVMLHADFSRYLDKAGVTPTLIFAGAHKVDGNPYEPLPEAVQASLKAEVDRFYELFVETVATGRRAMSPKAIRATEARTFLGAEAVAVGLADAVGTFEEVLADLSHRGAGSAAPRRGTLMSTGTSQPAVDTIARADHEAAVAAARAEGEASGRKAGRTEAHARVKAILGAEEAKGREALASHFAFETEMAAEAAVAALKVSPAAAAPPKAGTPPIAERLAGSEGLGAVVEKPKQSAGAGWDRAVAKRNARAA